ncbi:MAG TPA: hypothetical protein DCE33_10995 [Rhodospirillaceae bacterium]|nr:hypothetical protein [Rhodospirillaceae bacterium]
MSPQTNILTHWTNTQLPGSGELFIDHVAFFVDGMDGASGALEQLGFTATPLAPQSNARPDGPPPVPVGLANRCVMLERGYLEVLAIHKETDNPLLIQHRDALARHIGLHLLAFSTDDTETLCKNLQSNGFDALDPVALRRTVETEAGEQELRFRVQRVQPGQMPEGRVQALEHLTPNALWQQRWMTHPNGARALTDLLMLDENPEDAAQRYQRFTGREAIDHDGAVLLVTDRGRLTIATPKWIVSRLPDAPLPPAPAFVACALDADIAQAHRCLEANGLTLNHTNASGFWPAAPPALGGVVAFADALEGVPWLRS